MNTGFDLSEYRNKHDLTVIRNDIYDTFYSFLSEGTFNFKGETIRVNPADVIVTSLNNQSNKLEFTFVPKNHKYSINCVIDHVSNRARFDTTLSYNENGTIHIKEIEVLNFDVEYDPVAQGHYFVFQTTKLIPKYQDYNFAFVCKQYKLRLIKYEHQF